MSSKMNKLNKYPQVIYYFFKMLFLSLLALPSPVALGELPPLNHKAIQEIKKQTSGLISEKVYKAIDRASELAQRESYSESLKVLQDYLKSPYTKKGEQAQILRTIGFVYAQQEQYPKAIDYLQQALKTKKLPYNIHLYTIYSIAQIRIASQNYKKGVQTLKEWFSLKETPFPPAFVLYAICLLQQKQTDQALKYVNKALSLTSTPRESWLKFAASLYLNQGQYKKAQPLLEQMVAQFPTRPIYWKQLAGTYIYLDQNKKALITLNLAYKMKYLKSASEHLNLVKLLIEQNMPFQAAQILKTLLVNKVLKDNETHKHLLAESYRQARERPVALSFFNELFRSSKNEKIYMQYGYLLLEEEKWKKAQEVFEATLSLNSVKQKDKANLGLGIALFYQEQWLEALKHFRKSFEIDSEQLAAFHWIQNVETLLKDKKEQDKI